MKNSKDRKIRRLGVGLWFACGGLRGFLGVFVDIGGSGWYLV
jgi:hypothetical protein